MWPRLRLVDHAIVVSAIFIGPVVLVLGVVVGLPRELIVPLAVLARLGVGYMNELVPAPR